MSAAAGIAATIASGGNVAVGFAVGLGVSELWDTTGDIVAAAQGRDVNADGHSSLLTLEFKAATGQASWNDVKFTLKDEAIDVASNAVTLTGVGAGARMTESLTAQLALKDSLSVGGRTLLKVGLKEGSTDTLTGVAAPSWARARASRRRPSTAWAAWGARDAARGPRWPVAGPRAMRASRPPSPRRPRGW